MARPSRTGRDRKVQPPRPPNAWILYRSFQAKRLREDPKHARCSQASVSKLISDMWKNETEEVRRHFEQEAENKKAQHQELYPDYRFCPQRKDTKKNRKKSRCSDTTPSDGDGNDSNDVSPVVPAFPSIPFAPHPQPPLMRGGTNSNLPQHFTIPYSPEVRYGPGGPSPPMPAEISPMQSPSPLQPRSASSSLSSISSRLSPSSESQASSSSSRHPGNPISSPFLPDSHHPSPNSFTALPHPPFAYQDSAPSEPPVAPHLQSTENTLVPWNNGYTYLPSRDPRNLQLVHSGAPIPQTENVPETQQVAPPCSYAIEAMLAEANEISAFTMPNIEPSELVSPPEGDLDVALGHLLSPTGYEGLFFDFNQFYQQPEGDSSSAPQDNFQNLFHIPNAAEVEAYMAAQQRQPSAFMQDMMNFVNFEAGENSTQATPPVSAVPAHTALEPHQVHPQSSQGEPATSIFTQTTNMPAVAPGTPYTVGATFSSTHQAGGSWKPPFGNPSQTGEAAQPWPLR